MTKNALAHHPIKPRDDALHETHPFSFVAQRKSTSASTPYRQKAFSCDFMHPSLIPFRVPKRLAFKARVLLTFRTPLASNRLRHFFNAQATNNNNNNKRRSTRSFETEVTEENLASRASKSRESSRPKNEDDDDVRKRNRFKVFSSLFPGGVKFTHVARDERQQANEDRRHAEVHSPPRARESTTHGAGWSPRGSLDLDFRDVRVRVPSRRVYFSREEWYKRKSCERTDEEE